MFNMFNARKMRDEYNVFEGIFKAPIFLTIWILIVAFQVRLQEGYKAQCYSTTKSHGGVLGYLPCIASPTKGTCLTLLQAPFESAP